ncbi:MAG: Cytochrome biosis protein transrane region [Acidobacteriota bacterium]|jgi:sulfite exporter TauE/SafE
MTLFVAGLLLGLPGSAHCVFMCGPLVLTARCSTTGRVPWFLPYHAGRLLMYELLALAAGVAAGGRRGRHGPRAFGRVRGCRADGGGR